MGPAPVQNLKKLPLSNVTALLTVARGTLTTSESEDTAHIRLICTSSLIVSGKKGTLCKYAELSQLEAWVVALSVIMLHSRLPFGGLKTALSSRMAAEK